MEVFSDYAERRGAASMGSLPNISGLTGKRSFVVLSTQYAGQLWECTTLGTVYSWHDIDAYTLIWIIT